MSPLDCLFVLSVITYDLFLLPYIYNSLILIFQRGIQADKIEMLERERGWKEEAFDFVLQFLRTVLLKRKYRTRKHVCSRERKTWLTFQRRSFVNLHDSLYAIPDKAVNIILAINTIIFTGMRPHLW